MGSSGLEDLNTLDFSLSAYMLSEFRAFAWPPDQLFNLVGTGCCLAAHLLEEFAC